MLKVSHDSRIYIGKRDIFTVNDLDISEECEQQWITSGQGRLSTAELFETFPEGRKLNDRRLKREKKELGEAIDNLKDLRARMYQDNADWWIIQYVDENIDRMAKRYHGLGNRLRYGWSDDTDLERAKKFPIWELLPIESGQVFGESQRRRAKVKCPLHDDSTPSFTIYHDQNRFHCFGCGEHGDVIDLYMKLNNVDLPTAIKALS